MNDVKEAVLSYKDTISNVNTEYVMNHVPESDSKKFADLFKNLERINRLVLETYFPKINLGGNKEASKIEGLMSLISPILKDYADSFTDTPITSCSVNNISGEQADVTISLEEDFESLKEDCDQVENLYETIIELVHGIPDKEKEWVDLFLKDINKNSTGDLLDVIKDATLVNILDRLLKGEFIKIPSSVFFEIEDLVSKKFKNYLLSYDNGFCKLSVIK